MVTYKTPYHRIECSNTGLPAKFTSVAAPAADAPKIRVDLSRVDFTPFASHARAAECFAKYLRGQPFDIVRVDA